MTARLASWLRALLASISRGAVIVIAWCRDAWQAVIERHRDRLESEPGYRGALAGGLTAIAGTIAVQPAVAAALAVLIAEQLRARSPRVTGRRLWDEDWDDDDPDPLRPRWTHR